MLSAQVSLPRSTSPHGSISVEQRAREPSQEALDPVADPAAAGRPNGGLEVALMLMFVAKDWFNLSLIVTKKARRYAVSKVFCSGDC